MPFVLYERETWLLTLNVFENRVLRGIFGPKRDKVTREWRKLHSEELIICTPHPIFLVDKIKKNEMGGHIVHMWESRGVHRVLVGNLKNRIG